MMSGSKEGYDESREGKDLALLDNVSRRDVIEQCDCFQLKLSAEIFM